MDFKSYFVQNIAPEAPSVLYIKKLFNLGIEKYFIDDNEVSKDVFNKFKTYYIKVSKMELCTTVSFMEDSNTSIELFILSNIEKELEFYGKYYETVDKKTGFKMYYINNCTCLYEQYDDIRNYDSNYEVISTKYDTDSVFVTVHKIYKYGKKKAIKGIKYGI